MGVEQFSFQGKRALIIGGATGMGAAVAELFMSLGGYAIVMDVADISFKVDQSIKVDLSGKVSVDNAISQIDGSLDAVFGCAGIAGGKPIIFVNFIGQRHIIDTLINSNRVEKGGAVAMISSVAGMSWMQNLPELLEFLAQDNWQSAADWMIGREETHNNYMFSKQAVNAYVANQSLNFLKKGVRINTVMPGPTDTPLARANAEQWLGFGSEYRAEAGVGPLSAEQVANTLLFLCSSAASGISGISVLVDSGHISSVVSGAYSDPVLSSLL